MIWKDLKPLVRRWIIGLFFVVLISLSGCILLSIPWNTVIDPETDLETAADRLDLSFEDGTSHARAKEIIATVGGRITYYDRDMMYYQIKISGADLDQIKQIRDTLETFPEVPRGFLVTVSPIGD